MSAGRCQICGRRKYLRKSAVIAHHCVGGPVCSGTGHLPIECDDACLIAYAAQVITAYEMAHETVQRLEDARANWIDPVLIVRRGVLAGHALRLGRRLKRHREWPARYQRSIPRQMERYGYAWSDPPPAYLVERERALALAQPAWNGEKHGIARTLVDGCHAPLPEPPSITADDRHRQGISTRAFTNAPDFGEVTRVMTSCEYTSLTS